MNKKIVNTFVDAITIAPVVSVVLFLYVILEWVRFSFQLEVQKKFLLDFGILFGDTLVLHTCSIYYLSRALGKDQSEYTPLRSIFFSFISAPKILLSYMGLMLFTQFSLDVSQSSPFPVFFLLLFLIWAPYICSFEFFARELSKKEIEEEEDFYESLDEFSYKDIPSRLFTRKSWWQLGYMRSLEFSTSKITLSLTLVFLVWLLRLIPDLFVGFNLQSYSSFTPHFIKIVIGWFFGIFVHLCIIKSLFESLQPEQKDELSFENKEEIKSQKTDLFHNPIGIRLSIICILVITVTILWSEQKFQMGAFPESVTREIVSGKIKDNELIIELKLEDLDKKFRWFSPNRFRFQEVYQKKEDQSLSKNELAEKDLKEKPDPFSHLLSIWNEELKEPSRLVVYDSNRELVSDYQISPRSDPLYIVMAFPLKKRYEDSTAPVYEISFLSPYHYKEVLFTFKKDYLETLKK